MLYLKIKKNIVIMKKTNKETDEAIEYVKENLSYVEREVVIAMIYLHSIGIDKKSIIEI